MSMVVSSVSLLRSPIPRHIEGAGPDVDPTLSGVVLVSDIIYRIPSIRDGPAVCDHPAIQVLVSLRVRPNILSHISMGYKNRCAEILEELGTFAFHPGILWM
jgi:hypothetical protein